MIGKDRQNLALESKLQLFNTLGGQVEPLAPADGQTLRMYACGPTVYDYGHIGNFRTFLHVDVLRRVLRQHGHDRPPRHEHYRCRRQDHPQRGRRQPAHRGLHPQVRRRVLRGHAGAQRRAAGVRAARHRTHSGDGRAGRSARPRGRRLPGRGRQLVLPHRAFSRLRQAFEEGFRQHGGWRARRRGRVRQGCGARLRSLESR